MTMGMTNDIVGISHTIVVISTMVDCNLMVPLKVLVEHHELVSKFLLNTLKSNSQFIDFQLYL